MKIKINIAQTIAKTIETRPIDILSFYVENMQRFIHPFMYMARRLLIKR